MLSRSTPGRGGRAAEGAPLLREYGLTPIEGSNPSLSAAHLHEYAMNKVVFVI